MRTLAIFVGGVLLVALTVLSGVVHGWMTHRWIADTQLVDAGAALKSVPERFGKWRSAASDTLSENVKTMLEAEGYAVRTYVHESTREVVSLLLLVGPPGPIGAHTPEICFSGQGYSLLRERQRVDIAATDGTKHELWSTTFRNNDLNARSVRIYYGWTADGRWAAPESPRLTFADRPYLYKVQVSAQVPASSPAPALARPEDPAQSFLADFMAAVAPVLRPTGDESVTSSKD